MTFCRGRRGPGWYPATPLPLPGSPMTQPSTRATLRLLPLLLAALPLAASAQAQDPSAALTLEQAMADPDWIGPPVEKAWWSWDGREAQLLLKREGSAVRDTWRQPVAGGALERVSDADRGGLDAPDPVYDPQRRRMAYVRNGDVFVRDLATGALTQLTRTAQAEAQVRFAADGGVLWRVSNDWLHWSPGGVAAQVVALRAERGPAAAPGPRRPARAAAADPGDAAPRPRAPRGPARPGGSLAQGRSHPRRRPGVPRRRGRDRRQQPVAGRPPPAGGDPEEGCRRRPPGQDADLRHQSEEHT